MAVLEPLRRRRTDDVTKLKFRIVVLLPVVMLLGAIAILVRGHPEWPAPALQYLAWYQATPATAFEYWANLASMVSLLGLIAASVGVLFFWSPARYAYAVFLFLAVAADVSVTPVLQGMPDMLINNLAQVFAGVSLALMFTQPSATWFVGSRKA